MKKLRKCLAVLLCVLSAFSCIGMCANAAPAPQNVPLSQFLSDTVDLIPATPFAPTEEGVQAAGEQNTNRLIVRATGSFDNCGAVAQSGPFDGVSVLQYATADAAQKALTTLKKNSHVQWVCPDSKVEAAGNPIAEAIPGIAASGSHYFSWGGDYLCLDEYYSTVGTTGAQVTVAVIDSGVDTDHELFGGFYDPDTNPGGRLLQGASFVSGNDSFEDDFCHGTHTAGTIADLTPSYVKILPVKTLDDMGSGYTSAIMMGVLYAAEQGADLISMSLGGGEDAESPLLDYCIDYAYNHGALSVVAAGNESMDTNLFNPAGNEKCLVVSAVNKELDLTYFSNYGDEIDVCAPGEEIYSANIGGGYITMDGTSMATPHVSAVAAVYKANNPSLTPAELEQLVKDTATPLGAKGKFGSGLVALRASGKPTSTLKITTDEDGKTVLTGTPGTKIYYTTDGSVPGEASTLYTEPLNPEMNCLLRAVGYNEQGWTLPVSSVILHDDDCENAPVKPIVEGNTLVGYTGYPLDTFTIPEGVTKIGPFALDGLGVNIEGTEKITEVGVCGFSGTALYALDFPALKTADDCAFANAGIDADTLPNVETVGAGAFQYAAMENADLPKVKTIGYGAFTGCGLDSLNIPSVVTIGDHAFDGSFDEDDSIALDLPCVETIGSCAFMGVTYMFGIGTCPISSLNCPNLRTIDDYAFFACDALNEVRLPKLEALGKYVFAYSVLDKWDLPELRTMDEGAIGVAGCSEFVAPKLQIIGAYGLCQSNIVHLELPSLETAEAYAFAESGALETVALPKLCDVGDYAFAGCTALQKLNLPAAEHVGGNFAAGVGSVTVPDTLKQIDTFAFDEVSIVLASEDSPAAKFCAEYNIRCVEPGTMFTVRFYNIFGKLKKQLQVEAGDTITPPKSFVPFFRLSYWYEDGEAYGSYDSASICVTHDMDLHPSYVSVFENMLMNFLMWIIQQMYI